MSQSVADFSIDWDKWLEDFEHLAKEMEDYWSYVATHGIITWEDFAQIDEWLARDLTF
nr:hypothetical protein [Chloroflexota bacterium]